MDDKILSIKDIETLSKLASREQLLATLLAQLQRQLALWSPDQYSRPTLV